MTHPELHWAASPVCALGHGTALEYLINFTSGISLRSLDMLFGNHWLNYYCFAAFVSVPAMNAGIFFFNLKAFSLFLHSTTLNYINWFSVGRVNFKESPFHILLCRSVAIVI